MKGSWISYSLAELGWIEAHKELPRKEAHALFVAEFNRDDVAFDNFKALCSRRGWRTGRTGRIERGNIPFNKGKACEPGKGGRHPNSMKTQFPKGGRRGRAAENYKPIGSERISKDGYIERKVNDGLPLQARWKAVHRINWEAVHGPLPAGMFLKCLDGNRANTDASNWEALPRGAQPYLNGHRGFDYEAAAPEVRPSIIAVAKVRHAAKRVRTGQRAD